MNIIKHDSHFNHSGQDNFENYLKEEYKYDSIYDLVFIEIAFFWNDPGDNWEDKWEIIYF